MRETKKNIFQMNRKVPLFQSECKPSHTKQTAKKQHGHRKYFPFTLAGVCVCVFYLRRTSSFTTSDIIITCVPAINMYTHIFPLETHIFSFVCVLTVSSVFSDSSDILCGCAGASAAGCFQVLNETV